MQMQRDLPLLHVPQLPAGLADKWLYMVTCCSTSGGSRTCRQHINCNMLHVLCVNQALLLRPYACSLRGAWLVLHNCIRRTSLQSLTLNDQAQRKLDLCLH
jgi:hypothetical protein